MAILYRLKTGCQWRELPMKQFFRRSYRWQSVYYHFQKWSKDGSWEEVWRVILHKYKHLLDLSSIQLDGTHTPSKRGGSAVGYQGRKKCKTSNILIITDNRGIPLTCSEPVSGNHNDAYHLVDTVNKMLENIRSSSINTVGGYEHECIFDELLYKQRFVIERTNAWLDAFKAILVRFETNQIHWKALNLLAFTVILLRQL